VILKAILKAARLAWKVVAVVLVTLVVLFLLGWFVDVVLDPAEEEIR
jgi:hypothetical protein